MCTRRSGRANKPLFLFHALDRVPDDRVGKAPAHQSGHHEVAASGFQFLAVAAGHQRGGGFQLRVVAVLRGVDRFQRARYLGGGKPLLAQVLGGGAATFAGSQQAVCPCFGVAGIVHIVQLHHLGHSGGSGLFGIAAAQPLIQHIGRDLLPGQRFQRTCPRLGGVGALFRIRAGSAAVEGHLVLHHDVQLALAAAGRSLDHRLLGRGGLGLAAGVRCSGGCLGRKCCAAARFGKGGSMMILRLALQKIRAMAGGYGFFAAVLAAAFALFFIIAATLGTTRTQLLRIALTDEDDSPLSHEFAELLNDSDREITGGKMRFVSVRFGTREESEEAVRSGKAEGALIILKGFGAGLESGEEAFLEYRASADASSAQAAEEIIGGRAVALRSRLRSADYAKKLLNRGLTEKELSELEVAAKEYYNEQVGAVRFERIGGSVEKADSSVFGALRARFSGIGAFAVLTLLLTLGSWTGSNAARAAEKRLAAEKGGVSISFWSNFLALFICGIAMYAVMYIAAAAAGRNSPNGHELLAAGCYLFCASALALVVGGADISGRMNLAAPFIAFATSLLGGCFADTAARGGLFAKLALLTPQGLCIAGADGSIACLAVLAGAGVVLLASKRAALRVKFAERR